MMWYPPFTENRRNMEILRDFYDYYPVLIDGRGGFNLHDLDLHTALRMNESAMSLVTDGKYEGQDYRLVASLDGDGMLSLRLFETKDEVSDNIRYHTSFDTHNMKYALEKLAEVLPHVNPQCSQFDPHWYKYGY